MNLPDLTEPLFQFICRLNRQARKNAHVEFESVRTEVGELLTKMEDQADTDPRLAAQYRAVELPLLFFVDSMIAGSRLPFAAEWHQNRLAFDRNELSGDERFFELLDETMADSSEDATERLVIFYTCIGLGFTGRFAGQPEVLHRKALEIAPRIRAFIEHDDFAKICAETYEHLNTANLPMPVGSRLVGIAIVFVGLLLVVAAANFYLFRTSWADLDQALESISAHDPAPQPGQR
jgi:type VI secretion system protein ImpK